jgi:hypothetical protein
MDFMDFVAKLAQLNPAYAESSNLADSDIPARRRRKRALKPAVKNEKISVSR